MALPERLRWVLQGIDVGDIMRGVELARDRRLVCVEGDVHDVLPGIDLHVAPDTHTYGSMWVKVRNDGKENSEDVWVLAGDLVYQLENLVIPVRAECRTGSSSRSAWLPAARPT